MTFGDIVLFDDSGLMAHLVSGVTATKYDHIGIVVKKKGSVFWFIL